MGDLDDDDLLRVFVLSASIVFLAFLIGFVVSDLDRRIEQLRRRVFVIVEREREPEPFTIEQEPLPLMVEDDL